MTRLRLVDPSGLDEVWMRGVAPLIAARPASMVAPVLGFAWASLLAPAPHLLHLHGEPGSGKTALARIAVDFADAPAGAPARIIDGRPNSWGSTSKGIRNAIAAADLGPLVVDNVNELFNPRPGDRRMVEIANHVRAREIQTDPRIPPAVRRCSVITTSPELAPRDDVVHQVHVTDAGVFAIADTFLHGRAIEARHELGRELTAASAVEDLDGVPFAWWGITTMGEMLRHRSAVDVDELLEWGSSALDHASTPAASAVAESSALSARVIALQRAIVGGLQRGQVVLDDGSSFGRRDGDRVYIVPAAAAALLGRGRSSPTVPQLSAALAGEGLLVVAADGARTMPKRINGRLVRVWDLPAGFVEPAGYDFG